MLRRLFLLLLCLSLCSSAQGKGTKVSANDITLSAPSIHLPWGNPLAGPPLRVLFIAPRYAMRDVVELAGRLSLKYEAVGLWDSGQLEEGGATPWAGERLGALLEKQFDVIVAGNFDLGILPENVQTAILRQVSEGTGLFLAHHRIRGEGELKDVLFDLEATDTPPSFSSDIEEAVALGVLAQGEDVETAMYGLGRIVQVHYPGRYPQAHFLVGVPAAQPEVMDSFFDNGLSFVAHALLWAAGRSPSLWIAGVRDGVSPGPNEEEIPPGFPEAFVRAMKYSTSYSPMRPFVVTLSRPAESAYELSGRRHGPLAGFSWDPEPIGKGTSEQPVYLVAEPGWHQLDISLRDKKGVVDWYRKPLVVTDWPELLGVTMDKHSLLPNDVVKLDVFVAETITATTQRKCTVFARAVELSGRVVAAASKTVAPAGEAIPLKLSLADVLDRFVKIEVFALEGALTSVPAWRYTGISPWRRYLPVQRPLEDGVFRLVVRTPSIAEPNQLQYLKILQSLGVDSVSADSEGLGGLNAARAQLTFVSSELGSPATGGGEPVSFLTEQLRSYVAPYGYNGLTVGKDFGTESVTHQGWLPWYAVMHQIPSLWCMNPFGSVDDGGAGALLPDGRAAAGFAALAATVRTINKGIGPLLLSAAWDHCGIAVLDGPEDRSETPTDSAGERVAWESKHTPITLLERLGYQYNLIDEQKIRLGELNGYRVLILPTTGSLEEDVYRMIEAFVDSGGGLIADNSHSFGNHERLFSRDRDSGGRVLLLDTQLEQGKLEVMIETTLREMGSAPVIEMATKNGEPFRGERFGYRYGEAHVFGLLADWTKGRQSYRVTIPTGFHTYDPLTGLVLSKKSTFKTKISPGAAQFMTALPYEVTGLEVSVAGDGIPGKRLPVRVRVQTKGALCGIHLVQVQLIPEGVFTVKQDPVLLRCPTGVGETYLPLAHNETTGPYTLVARDLLSGVEGRVPVNIFPPMPVAGVR